jgi:transketolase
MSAGSLAQVRPHDGARPPPRPVGERALANAVRALAVDTIETAGAKHPGAPLGMAEAATALWTRVLRFDAADPRWPDRDRFVLSAGRGAALLYALLHLTGHDGIGTDDLRCFRQLNSVTPGNPEFGAHPAIEANTGLAGQGLATAVGMALAERLLAARFGRSLVDHRVWVIASEADLTEGVGHEAAGFAGHLRLDRLTVLYDANATFAGGAPDPACSEDVARRFAGYGWAVKTVDGHDPAALAAALSLALRGRKPTLIACRTMPGDAVSSPASGNRLPFAVPEPVAGAWRRAGARGAAARRAWLKRLARHPLRPEFERTIAGRLPDAWHAPLAEFKAGAAANRPAIATRHASQQALAVLAAGMPELVGGSADLAAATATRPDGVAAVAPGGFGGRFIHFGARENAMGGCLNGLALHGGVIPYGGTFLAFSDQMRPAIRLAAQMRQRLVLVFTHDSIGAGEDGPSHQPVEQLAGLRAIPNLAVFRPADAVETAECWELALRRADGPSVLALSRQSVPGLRADAAENRCARGGYVLAEADGPRRMTLIATGSEVALAVAARAALAAQGVPAAVVSLPCWELFEQQDAAWRATVLGTAPRLGIEAATGFGWERWLGEDGVFIGMAGFGASAPTDALYRHFGLTPQAVAAAALRRLG